MMVKKGKKHTHTHKRFDLFPIVCTLYNAYTNGMLVCNVTCSACILDKDNTRFDNANQIICLARMRLFYYIRK